MEELKVKTIDRLPPPEQPEITPPAPNKAARFLKGLFVNNWQLKITAVLTAAALWVALLL